MKNNDEDAFLQSIKGVSPIKKNDKIKKPVPKHKKGTILKNIKKPILHNIEIKINTPNTDSNLSKIQKTKINKKLKKGKIPIDRKIDFHGLSVFDAEVLFSETIKNCYKKNLRCILFVTGKGIFKKLNKESNNTKLYYGKIRNNFIFWTKKNELQKYILSVEQAGIDHGGDGAFFIYLRKQKF